MNTERSIAEKIKEHPIVVILAFAGAAIIGLASFTEALGTVAEKAKCIPIYLNLDDGYKGKGKLKYSTQKRGWVNIGLVRKTKPTGNHHCSRNCRGEPTRTNYEVSLTVGDYQIPSLGERKLVKPKLACKSGPCGGWNQVLHVDLTAGGKSVNASFDVWSNPTSWELTAEVHEYKVISERVVDEDVTITSTTPLELSIPSKRGAAKIRVKTPV